MKRYASVAGIPVTDFLDDKELDMMIERTRKGGEEIVKYLKAGSAFYAPGASVAKMVESIIKDEKRLISASVYLRGEYGYDSIFLGVPVILGKNGVERIVTIDLDEDEKKALDKSAAAVKKGVVELDSIYSFK